MQYAVGSDAMIGVGVGKCDVTGAMSTYFSDETVLDKFYAGSEASVHFIVQDAAGNAYAVEMPRIKYEGGNVVAGGQDQDVFADFNYRALAETALGQGYTIQICRFPVA